MAQPSGFTSDDNPTHICRMYKAIYGLKQAPCPWYNALTGYHSSIGFVKTKSDASLLVRHGLGDTLFVLVYVDDIIVTGSNTSSVNQLMTDCKSFNTPMSPSELLTLSDGTHLNDATRYRRVLGRLQYLSFTRPDIAYAVNKLFQFIQAPSDLHWKAVKRVILYLRGTIQLGLRVTPINDFNLHVYSDADSGGDISDKVSTSGYILFLGHNPISWSSKKQNIVSRSSIESEYRAVADAFSETLWVTNLLNELRFPVHQLPTIYCDNLGAIFLSKNHVLHSRVKHAAVDFHFVRHHVNIKRVRVVHVHGANQIANTITQGRSHLILNPLIENPDSATAVSPRHCLNLHLRIIYSSKA
ncbi:hypothetical protein KY289_020763 [Solanum tuberosum]|nr:hypothetical protein KY289_020763 [Solanum tuberosum]